VSNRVFGFNKIVINDFNTHSYMHMLLNLVARALEKCNCLFMESRTVKLIWKVIFRCSLI